MSSRSYLMLVSVTAFLWLGNAIAQVTRLGEDGKRPCKNFVSFFVDDEERWNRSLDELRKLDYLVSFTEGPAKGKSAIPLADLLSATGDVQAIEISTCTGKLRRFDAPELARKKDTLFFIITQYRGLKMHNADGGERTKKGGRLKHIDQIRLITPPE